MLTATQLNASDTQFIGLTDYYISSSTKEKLEDQLIKLNWSLDEQENNKLIQSVICKHSKEETNKADLPKDSLKSRIDLIQNITNEDSLIKVVNNILELETDDEWFIRGIGGLKRGSPTSAFLIWEQCSRSGKLTLEEVFQFELDLAIQVTRHQDFTEGIRAIIIDKDNNPQWIYTKVEDVTKEWIDEHLHPAWDKNPLKNLQN